MPTVVAGGVTIRAAQPADLAAVRALVDAAGLPLDGLDTARVVLIADLAGDIVGTAALDFHDDGRQTAYLLRSVAVAEHARGQAIGRRLVVAALEHVTPAAPVALLTETAKDYFNRLAFGVTLRGSLPSALASSVEFQGACPASPQP